MKKKIIYRILAVVMCAAILIPFLPLTAAAAENETSVSMTAGEVKAEFVPAGTDCQSSNPSVAWVDENGSLNALKAGTAKITSADGEYTVTVDEYSDGSKIAGNLKIVARYNDSMQFYDGHVYLMFTSYQDGMEIDVRDLYAAYEISDEYYKDIREDISNGSNHTGTDADKYFTFTGDSKGVKLDRGEVVTIGMYRDFDLSVPQAALGSIKNSSGWSKIEAAGKAAVIESIFKFLNSDKISTDEALERLKNAVAEAGVDYNTLLDGTVDGGVCFNRELYNQKLEWDQYENVTYDLDITENQLKIMSMYLNGNLNKFSILKNSCATVALRAWNAAVGTRNGEDTAYKLSPSGSGIFALVDAPKTVRDEVRNKLKGFYLNNAEGVAEPGAGYQDETGWVYVSAPKNVSPLEFVFSGDIAVDEENTDVHKLFTAAENGKQVVYNKDSQKVDVKVNSSVNGGAITIESVEFTANGETFVLTGSLAESGIWFKFKAEDDADYYVTDADGKIIPGGCDKGMISVYAQSLPITLKIEKAEDSAKNLLRTVIENGDKANTEVYVKDGGTKKLLESVAEVKKGDTIFVKSEISKDNYSSILANITFNGVSIMNASSYNEDEGAYCAEMPSKYSKLTVKYDNAEVITEENTNLQVFKGDVLDVNEYAGVVCGGEIVSAPLKWTLVQNPDGALEADGRDYKAVKEGGAVLKACSESNENISLTFTVDVFESADDAAKISFEKSDDFMLVYGETVVPYTDYLVKKGTEITFVPVQKEKKVPLSVTFNGSKPVDNKYTVTEDTTVQVRFASAEIQNMPETIKLGAKGDTYQLEAKTAYTGLLKYIPVYDKSIKFKSSDSIVTVDENGLITVAGEIPESGKAVTVTACAGSSNDMVYAKTKVVLGNYDGDRIVGRLTIFARRINVNTGQLVAHGCVDFTTYEDVEIPVSYYEYYKPNDGYNIPMTQYELNPESFSSDPALYNDDELGIENRDGCFDTIHNGSASAPEAVSLKAGESITVSNYGFDTTNMYTVMKVLENSAISASPEAQELVRQMKKYLNGEEVDDAKAFDSMVATLSQIYAITKATGKNPADGHSEGGMTINREMYNQFRRSDSQIPDNYYCVDITADELAAMQSHLENPENNYYSLLTKNCATGAVEIWNAALYDKASLQLNGNYTGLAIEPMSLYAELGQLKGRQGIDGMGGEDFYPRSVAYTEAVKDTIEKIKLIGNVEDTPECRARVEAASDAYDALNHVQQERVWNYRDLLYAKTALPEETDSLVLGDSNGDGEVSIKDVTLIQKHISALEKISDDNLPAADVNSDGVVDIDDATLIQKHLAFYKVDYPIGEKM